MDMESGKQRFIASVKKNKYILWIILAGIFLMLIPQNTEPLHTEIVPEETVLSDLEAELSAILNLISGVGKVNVLLTEATGSSTVYQTDTGQYQSSQDTVIIQNGNREESGLIKQILPPVYKGALVVCQGADDPGVRLSVVEAVKSVTGLSSDCIAVLKMK